MDYWGGKVCKKSCMKLGDLISLCEAHSMLILGESEGMPPQGNF